MLDIDVSHQVLSDIGLAQIQALRQFQPRAGFSTLPPNILVGPETMAVVSLLQLKQVSRMINGSSDSIHLQQVRSKSISFGALEKLSASSNAYEACIGLAFSAIQVIVLPSKKVLIRD